jgi:hypothetical protein
MGFVMATFYLVNWPDDDIRQISLEVSLGRRDAPCADLDKKCALGKCATSSPKYQGEAC